jgi:hypothetical protein
MLSVRLAAFPVESVALSELSPTQQQKFIADLNRYGDSRMVPFAGVPLDGDESGYLWPGIIKFNVDQYTEDFQKFREMSASPKIEKFRTFASKELNKNFSDICANSKVVVYPAVSFADCFSTYRLLQMSRVCRKICFDNPKIHKIVFRFKAGMLTLWFLDENSYFVDSAEFRFSEDRTDPIISALRYLEKAMGVGLEEVDEMPATPGNAVKS